MPSRPPKSSIETTSDSSSAGPSAWTIFAAGAGLMLATILAYHHSFTVPFLFDDPAAIAENPTIKKLWPLGPALSPPHAAGNTVGGRPLVNLSLAFNYAVGGVNVTGYHVVNLLIHLAGGLTLFGLMRRTLLQPSLRPRFGAAALPLAFVTTALWILHPLQTESVTYIVQRAESLMGLCYLLTLYGFVRGTECPSPNETRAVGSRRVWLSLSWAACLLGLASKESMASAPLIVFLYDRTFVAGSFRAAWRQRRGFHTGLASTWLLLGWLVFHSDGRGGTAGAGAWGATVWRYALTQCDAITRYAGLAVWPHPLVFDYGVDTVERFADVAPQAIALVVSLVATALALRRWPAAGFIGAWFFAILAPSSSFVPVATQTIAEHRMYLPLLAVIVPIVLGFYALAGRGSLFVAAGIAVGFGFLTAQRNEIYRRPLALWSDTVLKRPKNARAHNNLAVVLIGEGKFAEAAAQAEAALQYDPFSAETHNTLATALAALGRHPEAMSHLQAALRLKPAYAEAHNNLGQELMTDQARLPAALVSFERALQLRPVYPQAENNLGLTLTQLGRAREAVPHLEKAVQLEPAAYQAHNNLGIALASSGRAQEALTAFAEAASLNPTLPNIHENWAKALLLLGRNAEATDEFNTAARLKSFDR